MDANITVDGQSVSLHAAGAFAYTAGDFAGNIDLAIRVEPESAAESVIRNVRLRVPGEVDPLDVLAAGGAADERFLTFFSSRLINAPTVPTTVELQWAPTRACLGTLMCQPG